MASGAVRVMGTSGASADGARRISYTSGPLTALPSLRRAGRRHDSRASRSPGSTRKSAGASGAGANVTMARGEGALVRPCASAVTTTYV